MEKVQGAADENERYSHIAEIVPKCSSEALQMILQLLKNTIRANCSVENILDIIHGDAFELYQQNKNIDAVLSKYLHVPYPMKPIVKVVPKTCEFVYEALSQCWNPFCGINFGRTKFHFNRKNYHVRYYHDYINTEKTKPYQFNLLNEQIMTYAFAYSPELILDCQILNIDRSRTTPVVLIHDCMYLHGDITMKPLKRRRQLVQKRMVQDRDIYIYQLKEISTAEDVNVMISMLVQYDFGELFFRDGNKAYEEKNTLFKIDRKYFNKYPVQVNLLVLGGWLETDLEDETYWIFLMDCFDFENDNFCTAIKVRADPGI